MRIAYGIGRRSTARYTRGTVNEAVTMHSGTIYEPTEVIEAQFSLRFSLALRILKGSDDFKFYLDPKLWRDAEVLALGKKILSISGSNG